MLIIFNLHTRVQGNEYVVADDLHDIQKINTDIIISTKKSGPQMGHNKVHEHFITLLRYSAVATNNNPLQDL